MSTYWKFTKNKKGWDISKKEDEKASYSIGTVKANLMISLMHISHNFQENDIIDTGGTKEDLVFWHEDFNSYVLMPNGHTNNTVWFPRMTGMGEN